MYAFSAEVPHPVRCVRCFYLGSEFDKFSHDDRMCRITRSDGARIAHVDEYL